MLEKIVKKNNFASHADMKTRIAHLERVRDEQEDVLKADLIEIYKSLQPAELVKSAIDNIREDVEVGEKAGGLAGSLGLNYLIGKLMGKNNSPKGYLKALVVQQIASYLYRKNEKTINGFIGQLSRRAMKKMHLIEEEPEEFRMELENDELKELEKEEDQEMHESKDADPTSSEDEEQADEENNQK